MATRYQDISYGQFGGGIDALSPESKIPDGFVEDLRNVDPTPEGSLEKRKGYQLHGAVPVRVKSITYAQDKVDSSKGLICYYLDESVNVLNLKSSPIVVYGRTSECHDAGDWTDSNSYNYYPTFNVDVRRTIPPGTTQTEVLTGAIHKQGSDIEVLVVQAVDLTTTSNLQLIDNVSIDSQTGDISATLNNGGTSNLNVFLVAKSREAQAGSCYITQAEVNSGSSATITIPATDHLLNSFAINTAIYQVNNGEYELITPDSVIINPNGDVSINLVNNTGSKQTYRLLLFSPDNLHSLEWIVGGESSQTKPIQLTSDFPLFQFYSVETDSNGLQFSRRIWPEQIDVDSAKKEAKVTIRNNQASDISIRAYWDYAPLVSNRLTVTGSNPNHSSTEVVVQASEHKLGNYVCIQAHESLNSQAADSRIIGADLARVNLLNSNVELELTNNQAVNFHAWIALKQRPVITGSCYHFTGVASNGVNTFSVPQSTHKLISTRIGFDLYQVIDQTVGGVRDYSYTRIEEDAFSIANNGDISFTVSNNSGADLNILAYLYATDPADLYSGFANSQAKVSMPITMGENLFPFLNCYSQKVQTSTGFVTKTRIYPSNVVLNSTTNLAYVSFVNNDNNSLISFDVSGDTITWTNHGLVAGQPIQFQNITNTTGILAGTTYYVASSDINDNTFKISLTSGGVPINLTGTNGTAIALAALNLSVNWDYADVISGTYCIAPSVSSVDGYADEQVQMSIWGIPHGNLYGGAPSGTTPGWVTNLDVYRAQAEERPVSGLGGNLFALYSGSELSLPTYYPNLRARVLNEVTIAPAFFGTTDLGYDGTTNTKKRTHGWISFTGGETNQARVTQVLYNSSTGLVDYYLSTPNWTSPDLNLAVTNHDYLTATGMGYPIHAGEFLISSISQNGADSLIISVLNSKVTSSDWDDTDSGGTAGVFTDYIELDLPTVAGLGKAICPFIQGDRILSTQWSDTQFLEATNQSSSIYLRVKGLYTPVLVNDGLTLTGERSSRMLPTRYLDTTNTTYQLVPNDSINYNGLNRNCRVKAVRAVPTQIVNLSVSQKLATVTLASGDNKWLVPGQRVLLLEAGPFTGVQVISFVDPINTNQFSFETSYVGTYNSSIALAGYVIEVDEELDWADTAENVYPLQVAQRWMPIEAPDTGYGLVSSNHFRYLEANSYDSQPSLRSSTVNNTLYWTNGDDAIQRFDGTSLTEAGLIRWQSGLFLTIDTLTSGGKLTLNNPQIDSGNIITAMPGSTNILQVTDGYQQRFTVGDWVRLTTTTGMVTTYNDYVVQKIDAHDSPVKGYITLNAKNEITLGTTNILQKLSVFRYYFRLSLYDANDNRIITGATNAQDFVIRLHDSAAINMTLLRPAWLKNYDYSRVAVQVYRTKADESTNYYLVTTLKPEWQTEEQAYIQYTDRLSDESLGAEDAELTALSGIGLGQTWTTPPRAKFVASAANRLVLANIKSWPQLSITIADNSNGVSASQLSGLRWLLRKSNLDSEGTTNNLDRMGFEFLTSGSIGLNAASNLSIDVESGLVTVSGVSHGLVAAGNWVYLFHSTVSLGHQTRLGGWYQVVEVLSSTSFTYQIDTVLAATMGLPTLYDVDQLVHATNPADIPVWLGDDGLYQLAYGQINPLIGARSIATWRLSNAINAAQNVCSTTGFKPWVIAYAGGEYPAGQLILETPYVSTNTLEVLLPNYRGIQLFVNGILAKARQQVQAQIKRFPSRLVFSYANYPELFDKPYAYQDTDAQGIVDVNSADGQEITGIIPFFGESAFGAAQKDSILLVFKTASVYLVNIAESVAGRNPIQKLDTRHMGCTAPGSIAPTQNGIMFANHSGIYRITVGLETQYIGRRMERMWKDEVDVSRIDASHGYYSQLESKYKLAIPVRGSSVSYPTQAYVYDTVREYTADGYRDGSWTIYDNINAVGWVNLFTSSLFASPAGEVFVLRNAGDLSDYRDDGDPIAAQATLRALDFGSSGIRKTVSTFILQFRTALAPEQVKVESAINLLDQWEALDRATVKGRRQDSFSSVDTPRVAVIRFVSNRRKGVFFQLRVSNSNYDEKLEFLGGSVMVAALSSQGTVEAADT